MATTTSLFIVYRAPDAPSRISLKTKSVAGKESSQMVTSVPVTTDAPLELSRKNGHEAMDLWRSAPEMKDRQLAFTPTQLGSNMSPTQTSDDVTTESPLRVC